MRDAVFALEVRGYFGRESRYLAVIVTCRNYFVDKPPPECTGTVQRQTIGRRVIESFWKVDAVHDTLGAPSYFSLFLPFVPVAADALGMACALEKMTIHIASCWQGG